MKKKLTKDSFAALRTVGVVLDEQQARATKGGGYFDDYGTGYYDSSGNYHWNSTSSGSSSGYYGSSSGSYGSSSGSSSSSGWISQDAFYNWSGTWNGGYVEGLGYVGPDTTIIGSSSGYSPSSPYYNPDPLPNGAESLYMGAYDYGYQLGAAGGFLNSAQAIGSYLITSAVATDGGWNSNDPGMLNISKGILDGYLDGQRARKY